MTRLKELELASQVLDSANEPFVRENMGLLEISPERRELLEARRTQAQGDLRKAIIDYSKNGRD